MTAASPLSFDRSVASNHTAPQHKPRPLPLFLALLRSETATDPKRLHRALQGLRQYQQARRIDRSAPMPIVARAGRAMLRDYGGSGRPILFVPSLINPPDVLDLSEGNSLLRWLATRGVRPLLLDWGAPSPDDRDISVAGHVEQYLLPLLREIGSDAGLAGYCIGGTMAIAAAARHPVSSLTLIATPWHFNGFGPEARTDLVSLWEQAEAPAKRIGMLPMEVLQTSFWKLDPARTIAKFEHFATLDPDSDTARAFVALEDWANDGPPLTYAAGRELLVDLFGADHSGLTKWRVDGDLVDPRAITCPTLDIVSTTDRIVPAASASGLGRRLSLDLGHVGMIVGGRARARLWEPLADWLSQLRYK